MQELVSQSKIYESTVQSNTERDELILEHLPQIKYIAQRISTKLPSHVELNDLVSAGVLGLLDAIDKFDANRGVKFKTYAELRIKGAILDSLRNLDWAPRSCYHIIVTSPAPPCREEPSPQSRVFVLLHYSTFGLV